MDGHGRVWLEWCILAALAAPAQGGGPQALSQGLWISPDQLTVLAQEGEAWDSLLETANQPAGTPNISDQDDDTDVRTMAKALVYAATGNEQYRTEVIGLCLAAMETENGGRTLALGRNLIGYVIAADLVGLPAEADSQFRTWLDGVRFEELDGRTLISTHEDRPNNWGTHAGASRIAAAAFLGDVAEITAAATVFRGWLGDRDAYSGFEYGELWWQANPDEPVGINPVGSTIQGHSVDGVLPDDQRRGGPFEWPPPQENYVYEALQGAIAQAVLLDRLGYDVWSWSDHALLRAYQWLHAECQFPAVGDDTWQPHLVNYFYHTNLPAPVPSNPGKNVGWTDWTHGSCNADLNGDGMIGDAEVELIFDNWGCTGPCPGDANGDQVVDNRDYLLVLGRWGECGPGPSGFEPVSAPPRDPFAVVDRIDRRTGGGVATGQITGLSGGGSSGIPRRRPQDIAGTVRGRARTPWLSRGPATGGGGGGSASSRAGWTADRSGKGGVRTGRASSLPRATPAPPPTATRRPRAG